jgi:hypothetical protein
MLITIFVTYRPNSSKSFTMCANSSRAAGNLLFVKQCQHQSSATLCALPFALFNMNE